MTNHFENGVMTVLELVYTSPRALCELLSFIRMYEGELEEVELANIAMSPEVDMLLRNYTHTRYRLLPDIAAKVINTEGMLLAASYPTKEGSLTINVPDGDEGVRGCYKLEWGGEDKRVQRLSDSSDADAVIAPTTLARLLYGYDMINATTIPYLSGVSVEKNIDQFVAAFPKRNVGVFEHF